MKNVLTSSGMRKRWVQRRSLSPADVKKIRKLHEAGESMRAIARKYDLAVSHVWSIIRRRSWRDV